VEERYFIIRSKQSGLVLTTKKNTKEDICAIFCELISSEQGASDDQLWALEPNGDYFIICNKSTLQVLTAKVVFEDSDALAELILLSKNGNFNQNWIISYYETRILSQNVDSITALTTLNTEKNYREFKNPKLDKRSTLLTFYVKYEVYLFTYHQGKVTIIWLKPDGSLLETWSEVWTDEWTCFATVASKNQPFLIGFEHKEGTCCFSQLSSSGITVLWKQKWKSQSDKLATYHFVTFVFDEKPYLLSFEKGTGNVYLDILHPQGNEQVWTSTWASDWTSFFIIYVEWQTLPFFIQNGRSPSRGKCKFC